MSNIKVCAGFLVQFTTAAPKRSGPGAARKRQHDWSILSADYERVLQALQNGINYRDECYQFKQDDRLGDHPKFKNDRPLWSGQAVVNGTSYECHVFESTVPVILD